MSLFNQCSVANNYILIIFGTGYLIWCAIHTPGPRYGLGERLSATIRTVYEKRILADN